jgi:hypothetical protein
MWRIGWAPNNVSKWHMGFNSAFKGLSTLFKNTNIIIICSGFIVKTGIRSASLWGVSVTLVAPHSGPCERSLYLCIILTSVISSTPPPLYYRPGLDLLRKRSVMSLPGNEVRFLGCSVFSLVAILTVDQFSHVEVRHSQSCKQLKIPSLNTQTSVI